MSFANAELKYRLQRLEARRAVDADMNQVNQQTENDINFTTAEDTAQTKLAAEQSTLTPRASLQPNKLTMIVSSVPTDVLEPQRTDSKFSKFFTSSKASSKTATSSTVYNAISQNLQAVLGSINEWMKKRAVDADAYKMDNYTAQNYTLPISDNYQVSEDVHAPAITTKSNSTQYCVTEFNQKTTPNIEATKSSYEVDLNSLPNMNKKQCVRGVSNVANEYMVNALGNSTACTCTVDMSSDTSDKKNVCSGACSTQCVAENSQMMYSVEKELHTNSSIKTTTEKPYANPYNVKVHVCDVLNNLTNSCNEKYCEAFAGKKMKMHDRFAERLSCIDEIDEVHDVK